VIVTLGRYKILVRSEETGEVVAANAEHESVEKAMNHLKGRAKEHADKRWTHLPYAIVKVEHIFGLDPLEELLEDGDPHA
jgi:hypothetical protein